MCTESVFESYTSYCGISCGFTEIEGVKGRSEEPVYQGTSQLLIAAERNVSGLIQIHKCIWINRWSRQMCGRGDPFNSLILKSRHRRKRGKTIQRKRQKEAQEANIINKRCQNILRKSASKASEAAPQANSPRLPSNTE